MEYSKKQKELLKGLPKVDELMGTIDSDALYSIKLRACREAVNSIRAKILSDQEVDQKFLAHDTVRKEVLDRIEQLERPSLRPLVNATGVVVHTNLGRSLLPPEIIPSMMEIATKYSNLEYNLETGVRGSRYSHVEDILCELTGAESALVVNNNAAAVLITLETMAKGKEVIVSRGELVEIGGSFRIPDVMARSGAILKEVGATNKTHLRDYEAAINENTALLMKVHKSNFSIVGFTKEVSVKELSDLKARYNIPIFEDLGSGTLVDFSKYGLIHEPTVQEALTAGADIVSFSGDKLLGGPQAGIILGKREFIDKIKKNPLNRAIRIDKLTLVALEGMLRLYRDEEKAVSAIPTLRMLTMKKDEIKKRAKKLLNVLKKLGLPGLHMELRETISRVGGGALPLQELKSFAVTIRPDEAFSSASFLERILREHKPPVIVRIENDMIYMDARTILESDIKMIKNAFSFAHRSITESK